MSDVLVLGRKPGQCVVIDKTIIVKVVRSTHGDLRLAIDAPPDVEITRGELIESGHGSNGVLGHTPSVKKQGEE